jgi:hypothetical protein
VNAKSTKGAKTAKGAIKNVAWKIPTDLITRQEAAKLLGLNSPRMVDRLAAAGKLRKFVLPFGTGRGGSRVRVSRAEVEALLSPRMVKPRD